MHETSGKILVEKKYINLSLYLMPITASNHLWKTLKEFEKKYGLLKLHICHRSLLHFVPHREHKNCSFPLISAKYSCTTASNSLM